MNNWTNSFDDTNTWNTFVDLLMLISHIM